MTATQQKALISYINSIQEPKALKVPIIKKKTANELYWETYNELLEIVNLNDSKKLL